MDLNSHHDDDSLHQVVCYVRSSLTMCKTRRKIDHPHPCFSRGQRVWKKETNKNEKNRTKIVCIDLPGQQRKKGDRIPNLVKRSRMKQ